MLLFFFLIKKQIKLKSNISGMLISNHRTNAIGQILLFVKIAINVNPTQNPKIKSSFSLGNLTFFPNREKKIGRNKINGIIMTKVNGISSL